MVSDPLKLFDNMSVCPACGCIERKGSFRCLGCGSFHSTAHLVERDAPPPESRTVDEVVLDPLAYSMGPNQEIIEEEFEQSEDVKSWDGGSTDFSFDDSLDDKDRIETNRTEPKIEEL